VTIAILPMDNRPPNYDFLIDLSKGYALDIQLPDRDRLGNLREEGDMTYVSKWLAKTDADFYLIAVDMLCYGGLVSSRKGFTSLEQAQQRLREIEQLKRRRPKSKIFLSSIVRRASITVDSQLTQRHYDAINDYLHARAQASDRLSEHTQKLPKELIKSYWDARNRNHRINLNCLDLVGSSTADLVVFAQEDTFVGGPQSEELSILDETSRKMGIGDRVSIHNGADEVLQELLIRTFNHSDIQIVYDSRETKEKVMEYEDRRFELNVHSHARLTGFHETNEADRVILICGSSIEKSLNQLEELNDSGKSLYILDVFHPNGSNPAFVERLLNTAKNNLRGYSAWNTASNSLGTLLAQAARSNNENQVALSSFLLKRFIDDHLYQGIYRARLEEDLKTSGEDIHKVSNDSKILNKFITLFHEMSMAFLKKYFKDYHIQDLIFSLPWNRTFECNISFINKKTVK